MIDPGSRNSPPDSSAPSAPAARRRWVRKAVIGAEVLFIVYLVAEAFNAESEWRLWYLLGAGGLALMVGVLIWSSWRRRSL